MLTVSDFLITVAGAIGIIAAVTVAAIVLGSQSSAVKDLQWGAHYDA